jgi:hypothetical protein
MIAVASGRRAGVALLAVLPLLLNFVLWTTSGYDRVQWLRRYGEDMAVATSAYLERRAPSDAAPILLSSTEAMRYAEGLQRFLLGEEQRLGMKPWQFWRVVPDLPPARPGLVRHRSNDDVGRAWLSTLAFRLRGGIAPFLPLWLALFACLPVLAWLGWELWQAGHGLAASLFAIGIGCSCYVVETLALANSAFGFYLVGLIAVGAFSTYMFLRAPNPRGLLLRAAVLGVALGICALCRAGVVLFLPGVLLALLLGVQRIGKHRLALVAAAMVLVVLPYGLVRPPSHHEVWTGVWEGLGDYDRTMGHVWADRVALKLLLDAGFDRDVAPDVEIYDRDIGSPEKEAFFRGLVWRDVRADPIWYFQILLRRLVATVTEDELLVMGGRAPRGELALRGPNAPIAPNQGNIRFFYRLVPTADWFGLGPRRLALPLSMLWIVGASFVAIAARSPAWRPAGLVVLCTACSALVLPVAITTAGALEPQAFIIVYILAGAFLAEVLYRAIARR